MEFLYEQELAWCAVEKIGTRRKMLSKNQRRTQGLLKREKNGWRTLRRSCQFAFRIGIGRARRDEIHPRVPPLPIQRPGVMMSQKMARKNVPL